MTAAPSPSPASPVTRWLERAPTPVFVGYAVFAAFSTYACMYAFRKPFAVALYAGKTTLPLVGELDTKVVYLIAQLIGYAASKFIGIKVISEMTRARRAGTLVLAIATAELALVLFGMVPRPFAPLCLVLNGLPLGMVWGLVFGYVEGRRVSDALGAGLSASFIVASGFVKSAGKLVLEAGVSERWMPAAVGALFLVPTFVFIAMLAQLPPPSLADEAARLRREPMDNAARRRFFLSAAPGIVALTLAYVLLSAYRDFRDNFARELWGALGHEGTPSLLTTAELPVAAGALLATGAVMAVRDNARALAFVHALLLFGAALIGVSTLLFQWQLIGPVAWMVLVGIGLYVGYVPYNCVLFDRLIPALGFVGTAGFLIYVTDAFGYLGSVALMLYRSFGHPDLSWLSFFAGFSYVTAAVTALLFGTSALYFARRARAGALATTD
ncbi:MAG: hypothetical protein EXR75_07740 [Myxococcales bacterium]|nr:hypothetical protein [Myxococcales bacterium]